MDELYLDNIDEYVNDHNKIVTYKWLSLTLGVHVNTAKQMLYHYLDHKRKESSAQLHATYLVSGKCAENGHTGHKISVVREDQLEDAKSRMSLLVSVHVYSVQKAVLRDSGTLYSVDYDAVKDNLKNCSRYSAIRCAGAEPRPSVEVEQVPAPEPQQVKSSTNGHGSLASKASTKTPKGIMGMFASKTAPKNQNQDAGKAGKSEPKEVTPVVEDPKSKLAVKTNPMINFFGNQVTKRPDKTLKEEEEAPSTERPDKTLKVEEDSPSTAEQTAQHQPEPVAVEPPRKAKKDSRSKSKRVEHSDSEEEKMEKKRRRRIKKPQPDSSDDEVIPDSPQQQRVREPSPSPERQMKSSPSPERQIKESVSHSNQQHSETKIRKRRRVMKSRTFMDDEGCIVTEKAYESESYSEAEEEVKVTKAAVKHPVMAAQKKEDEKKSRKKPAAANKGSKQASIMGFFQKK